MLQNFNKSVCLLPRAPGWYAADANSGCTAVGSISRSSPHRHALSHTLWAARNFSHEVTTAPHGPPITARSVTAWNPRALEVAHGPLRAQKSREVFSPPFPGPAHSGKDQSSSPQGSFSEKPPPIQRRACHHVLLAPRCALSVPPLYRPKDGVEGPYHVRIGSSLKSSSLSVPAPESRDASPSNCRFSNLYAKTASSLSIFGSFEKKGKPRGARGLKEHQE
jgi:hypothetical protein